VKFGLFLEAGILATRLVGVFRPATCDFVLSFKFVFIPTVDSAVTLLTLSTFDRTISNFPTVVRLGAISFKIDK